MKREEEDYEGRGKEEGGREGVSEDEDEITKWDVQPALPRRC